MTDGKTIGIHFGALCDPIEKQLKEQRIFLDHKYCERFQAIADAITMLNLYDIISDSVTQKAHQKLMNEISKSIHAKDAP